MVGNYGQTSHKHNRRLENPYTERRSESADHKYASLLDVLARCTKETVIKFNRDCWRPTIISSPPSKTGPQTSTMGHWTNKPLLYWSNTLLVDHGLHCVLPTPETLLLQPLRLNRANLPISSFSQKNCEDNLMSKENRNLFQNFFLRRNSILIRKTFDKKGFLKFYLFIFGAKWFWKKLLFKQKYLYKIRENYWKFNKMSKSVYFLYVFQIINKQS